MHVLNRVRISRVVAFGVCIGCAATRPVLPLAQSSPTCVVAGTIASSRLPLPGVVVTLLDAGGRTIDAGSSASDGTYALKLPTASGAFTLKAVLVAFAPISREVNVDPAACGH